jgi:iron complex outermembrane receptor protein
MAAPSRARRLAFGGASVAALVAAMTTSATAQTTPSRVGEVVVTGAKYSGQPQYTTPPADLGPLGQRPVLDTPASVTTVPEDLIVNLQARSVNDTLRYLPSVQVRDQQGFEVSRPQSRGFQGSIVQDTRVDGLNVVGTTAMASEGLAGVQVLNGLAGALYGPAPPAGVFNYQLKRPTDQFLGRAIGSFDSSGVFTGQADVSGRAGPVGVRLNVLDGAGEGYVKGSRLDRQLLQGDVDVHIDDHTVLELDATHYRTSSYGFPGSIVYFSGKSTVLPPAIDPTKVGYGQPGAGADLITDDGLAKLKHDFGNGWSFEAGGLYMNAKRNLFGITNQLTDDQGDYTVTKNFTAVPHFTVLSNSAQLNGHLTIGGLLNDVSIGANGFDNGQYSYRNSIAVVLGTGNLANPTVLPTKPTPNNGGEYQSGRLSVQSLILGDTLHLSDQWAVQATVSDSYLRSRSFSAAGLTTSSDTENGVLSPTVSLTYKPVQNLTLYATYANSIEQGETAPAGTVNVNQILTPYHDTQYEVGIKYALTPDFLITAAGFRMTRPLAQTVAQTGSNLGIFEVVGAQRNWGGELFGQGAVNPWLSVLGGVTYIDARLVGAPTPATNNKRVVGAPDFKGDMAGDFHPDIFRGVGLTGALHFEGERAATNTNNSFAPSYATVDLGVRYSAAWFGRHETARLQVINVSDTRYYSSIADGTIVGSPGANTAYSGAPRTVMASLEFDF